MAREGNEAADRASERGRRDIWDTGCKERIKRYCANRNSEGNRLGDVWVGWTGAACFGSLGSSARALGGFGGASPGRLLLTALADNLSLFASGSESESSEVHEGAMPPADSPTRTHALRKRDVPAELAGERRPINPTVATLVALPDLVEQLEGRLDVADPAAAKMGCARRSVIGGANLRSEAAVERTWSAGPRTAPESCRGRAG
jgi:hypothetical protein